MEKEFRFYVKVYIILFPNIRLLTKVYRQIHKQLDCSLLELYNHMSGISTFNFSVTSVPLSSLAWEFTTSGQYTNSWSSGEGEGGRKKKGLLSNLLTSNNGVLSLKIFQTSLKPTHSK